MKEHIFYSYFIGTVCFIYVLISVSHIFLNFSSFTSLHYGSFVLLLFALIKGCGKFRINKPILTLGGFCVAVYIQNSLGRDYWYPLFELIVFPSLLVGMKNAFRVKHYKILLGFGIAIFIINAIVVFIEYRSHINLFYYDLTYFARFRTSGIWGHPLYGALITGLFMILIIMSFMGKIGKYIIWIVGFIVLLCYDARLATSTLIVISLLCLYFLRDISKKYFVRSLLFLVLFFLLFGLLSESDIGGRLFNASVNNIKSDSSIEARFVAFEMLSDLDIQSLLFGVKDQFELANQYHVLCAENAFIAHILVYGLPIAIFNFYIIISNLFDLTKGIILRYRILIMAYILITGMFSQSLLSGYVWHASFFYFIFICYNHSRVSRFVEIKS